MMNIAVGLSTPIGSYPLAITFSGGGIQQTTTVNLAVGREVALLPSSSAHKWAIYFGPVSDDHGC